METKDHLLIRCDAIVLILAVVYPFACYGSASLDAQVVDSAEVEIIWAAPASDGRRAARQCALGEEPSVTIGEAAGRPVLGESVELLESTVDLVFVGSDGGRVARTEGVSGDESVRRANITPSSQEMAVTLTRMTTPYSKTFQAAVGQSRVVAGHAATDGVRFFDADGQAGAHSPPSAPAAQGGRRGEERVDSGANRKDRSAAAPQFQGTAVGRPVSGVHARLRIAGS